jgi:ABC-type dipeptide/oligopeptide/nickel transport system ATPase subunit
VELPDGEPPFGPWQVRPIDDLLDDLGRPALLAVDGRSGSGKTTVTRRIVDRVAGAVVVHTDDIAW